mmetsp:Transcript_21569/g.50297  ORF Transcript_21569/g.50297 Transcript_21569/m.50297 type:complete len:268 (+) Transcript_21569:342-1145(+)
MTMNSVGELVREQHCQLLFRPYNINTMWHLESLGVRDTFICITGSIQKVKKVAFLTSICIIDGHHLCWPPGSTEGSSNSSTHLQRCITSIIYLLPCCPPENALEDEDCPWNHRTHESVDAVYIQNLKAPLTAKLLLHNVQSLHLRIVGGLERRGSLGFFQQRRLHRTDLLVRSCQNLRHHTRDRLHFWGVARQQPRSVAVVVPAPNLPENGADGFVVMSFWIRGRLHLSSCVAKAEDATSENNHAHRPDDFSGVWPLPNRHIRLTRT